MGEKALNVRRLITKVTTYGGPSDPYVRIVEECGLDALGRPCAVRTVYSRAQAKQIQCPVTIAPSAGTPEEHGSAALAHR